MQSREWLKVLALPQIPSFTSNDAHNAASHAEEQACIDIKVNQKSFKDILKLFTHTENNIL